MATVLITGTNRGIGLELVRRYLHEGWQVYACCRNPQTADELRALTADNPLSIHALDLLDESSIEVLKQDLQGKPLDLLVNNAGMGGDKNRQSLGNMDYRAWLNMLQVNTLGPLRVMEALLDNLLAGEQKHVVTISSALASIAHQQGYMLAYSSSKTAVNSVMKSLSCVLEDQGVRVNVLSPGWVRTEMGGPEAELTAKQSAGRIYQNIASLDAQDTGLFLDHDGHIIAW